MNALIKRTPRPLMTYGEQLIVRHALERRDFAMVDSILRQAIMRSLGVPKHILLGTIFDHQRT